MGSSCRRKQGAQNRVQDPDSPSFVAWRSLKAACHSLTRRCRQKKREIGLSHSEPSHEGFSRASLQGPTVEG